jgi:hypothetical protein
VVSTQSTTRYNVQIFFFFFFFEQDKTIYSELKMLKPSTQKHTQNKQAQKL